MAKIPFIMGFSLCCKEIGVVVVDSFAEIFKLLSVLGVVM